MRQKIKLLDMCWKLVGDKICYSESCLLPVHYLGLRHIDDKDRLMYSEEFTNTDSADIYDEHDYNMSKILKPEIITMHDKSI